MGFAIPANTANLITQQIIEEGYFSRPYLGIQWQAINPIIAANYSLPVEYGAYITNVVADSPAGRAGVQPGDILIRIGENELDADTSFVNALFSQQPGDTAVLGLLRNDSRIEIERDPGRNNFKLTSLTELKHSKYREQYILVQTG